MQLQYFFSHEDWGKDNFSKSWVPTKINGSTASHPELSWQNHPAEITATSQICRPSTLDQSKYLLCLFLSFSKGKLCLTSKEGQQLNYCTQDKATLCTGNES